MTIDKILASVSANEEKSNVKKKWPYHATTVFRNFLQSSKKFNTAIYAKVQ